MITHYCVCMKFYCSYYKSVITEILTKGNYKKCMTASFSFVAKHSLRTAI